jgi:hypothetical protein
MNGEGRLKCLFLRREWRVLRPECRYESDGDALESGT